MSELNDMTCAELADVAAELALGVLTGRERASAIAHLDNCEACREDVRQLMVTGEQLLELLPYAEPPAGFETRVLERLGLPGPGRAVTRTDTYPQLISRHESTARQRGPGRDRTRPGADQPAAPPAGPGGTRRPGRVRRLLGATAIGLAVIAAGLGGWRIGVGTGSAESTATGPLTTASLLSATHQEVGEIFFYSTKSSRWLYMTVDLGSGNESVTCQIVSADGQVTTLRSLQLADGYGSWGGPEQGAVGSLSGARIVSASGVVLATATFAD
jgi:hypothetical protein